MCQVYVFVTDIPSFLNVYISQVSERDRFPQNSGMLLHFQSEQGWAIFITVATVAVCVCTSSVSFTRVLQYHHNNITYNFQHLSIPISVRIGTSWISISWSVLNYTNFANTEPTTTLSVCFTMHINIPCILCTVMHMLGSMHTIE